MTKKTLILSLILLVVFVVLEVKAAHSKYWADGIAGIAMAVVLLPLIGVVLFAPAINKKQDKWSQAHDIGGAIHSHGGIKSASILNKRAEGRTVWVTFRVFFNDGTTGTVEVSETDRWYREIIHHCY